MIKAKTSGDNEDYFDKWFLPFEESLIYSQESRALARCDSTRYRVLLACT